MNDKTKEIELNNREHLFGTLQPVAFVTGSGATRVGREIAWEFGRLGYRVVIHANRSIKPAKEFLKQLADESIEAMLVQGSIDDDTQVKGWMLEVEKRFGRLDVLVHSAAVWDPKPLEEITKDDLDAQVRTNLYGSFFVARSAGLTMSKQSTGGSIVLIGDWAIQRPYAGFSAYFLSKGGIPTLTRTLAVELAARNPRVRVNAIMPGPVLLADSSTEELAKRLREQSLLKRDGTAHDVAAGALFLAEQPFITGVTLPIDGGRSIYASSDQDQIAHPDWNAS